MVTPGNGPQLGEEVTFDGPGEYFKEIMRPTTLHRTRWAVAQLLDDLSKHDSQGGELSGQLRTVVSLLMRRARACGGLTELHAAVSLAAALHMDEALDPFLDDGSDSELGRDQIAALVESAEAEVAKLCAGEGSGSGAAVMRSIQDGTGIADSGNEVFQNCFFDPAQAGFQAPFFDICNTIVAEESQPELKKMHEELAQYSLFRPPQLLPGSKAWHITVASSRPLVFQGHMDERMAGSMRLHAFVADEGKAVIEYVVITRIQRSSTAPVHNNERWNVAALEPQRLSIAAAEAPPPPQRRSQAATDAEEWQPGERGGALRIGEGDELAIPLPLFGDGGALTPLHGEAGEMSFDELLS